MTYESRLRLYEAGKRTIAREAKDAQEYERRVTALAERLGL